MKIFNRILVITSLLLLTCFAQAQEINWGDVSIESDTSQTSSDFSASGLPGVRKDVYAGQEQSLNCPENERATTIVSDGLGGTVITDKCLNELLVTNPYNSKTTVVNNPGADFKLQTGPKNVFQNYLD